MTTRGEQIMETKNRPSVGLADSLTIPGAVIIGTPDPRGKVRAIGVLTREELQIIVQQAHDLYGITADPFATPGSADVERVHDVSTRVHNHPPYEPPCNERSVAGQLRGACLHDDGSTANPWPAETDPAVAALVDDHSRCKAIGEWYGVPVHAFAVQP